MKHTWKATVYTDNRVKFDTATVTVTFEDMAELFKKQLDRVYNDYETFIKYIHSITIDGYEWIYEGYEDQEELAELILDIYDYYKDMEVEA